MNRKSEELKEKQISEVMASIENRVRHAYNQGYEQGIKASKQEPKTGHWIAEKIYPPLSDAQRTVYRCSCCDLHFGCVSNYCPNCGAKMEMRIRNE